VKKVYELSEEKEWRRIKYEVYTGIALNFYRWDE